MSEESLYKLYSKGIAAENKALGSLELEVIPLEKVNFADGELNARGEVGEISGTDSTGKQYADRVVTTNSLPATWRRIGESNRITPPDVRRGEPVLIYTYADTGKFFWTTDGVGNGKRRLETVAWAFSGTEDESVAQLSDENSYVVEVSTHKKRILIATSKVNGEQCRFFLQIDPGTGKATLADDDNNEVTLDSTQSRITMLNKDNTEVTLERKNLTVKVPGHEAHDVKGDFNLVVAGDAQIKVGGNAFVEGPEIFLKGNTTVDGNFAVTGATILNGATSPKDITAPNIG